MDSLVLLKLTAKRNNKLLDEKVLMGSIHVLKDIQGDKDILTNICKHDGILVTENWIQQYKDIFLNKISLYFPLYTFDLLCHYLEDWNEIWENGYRTGYCSNLRRNKSMCRKNEISAFQHQYITNFYHLIKTPYDSVSITVN
jgi:hypothetical protein